MRPLELTMEAFGSFARGTIDFTRLDPQLYLVAGDTGAGKTTVFDAIVFALYGEASGPDRKPGMMHSDHCAKSEDTVVRLRFLQNGHTYTVERRMHFKRRRATGLYDDTPDITANLLGEGFSAVEGTTTVTDEIVKLTGVTADQFRKIAMLAQGEFRAFLKDEKGRGAILEKLFEDSLSLYQRYEQLLLHASRALERRREEDVSRIERALEPGVFPIPEGWSEEQRAGLTAHNERLLENLGALCAGERDALARLETEIRNGETREKELSGQLAAARHVNDALDALDRAKARQTQLQSRAAEMEELAGRLGLAERALHGVRPQETALRRAEEDRRDAQLKLEESKAAVQAAEKQAQAAKALAEEAAGQKPEADAQRTLAEGIEKELPMYRERAEKQRQLARAAEEQGRAEADFRRLGQKTAEAEEGLQRTAVKLAGLSDAEQAKAEAEKRHLLAEQRLSRLTGRDGLKPVTEQALARRAQMAKAVEACGAAVAAAKAQRQRYEDMNHAFLRAQAGLIGLETQKKLETVGRVKCPVCFALYTAEQPVRFAKPEEGAPTEEALERCEAEKRKAEQKETDCRIALDSQRAAFETLRDSAAGMAEALGLTADFDALCAGGLERAIGEARRSYEEATAVLSDAAARADEKKKLEMQRESLFTAAHEARAEADAAAEKKHASEQAVAALTAALEGMKRLAYESAEEAETAIAAARANAAQIERRISDAQQAERSAHGRLQAARASESSAAARCARAGETLKQAEDGFAQALDSAGFADEAAYRAALPPDGEAWLAARRKELDGYTRSVSECEGALKTAGDAVKAHPERVDTGALETALLEQGTVLEARRGEQKAQLALLTKHEGALTTVRGAKARLASSDGASVRLARLAQLAVKSDKSARMLNQSFSRHMTTYIFLDILEEANRHMRQLTGGQYAFVHRKEARKGYAQGGLLIDVEDALTGETRDTASLSGGESFLASLSLALGLSTVVQRRSGVRRVDAMFIDEGFGTLSDRELDAAVEMLRSIAGGSCQIGIISHVAKLEECIESQLRVTRTQKGSRVELRG